MNLNYSLINILLTDQDNVNHTVLFGEVVCNHHTPVPTTEKTIGITMTTMKTNRSIRIVYYIVSVPVLVIQCVCRTDHRSRVDTVPRALCVSSGARLLEH